MKKNKVAKVVKSKVTRIKERKEKEKEMAIIMESLCKNHIPVDVLN